ncbi:MAG: YihY family inner membrane protein [Verrucomicrobia bacterium]|nr:YihY family inner membrane protein [Verrucomicrobiota bacterium]
MTAPMVTSLFSRLKRIVTGDTDADADAPLLEAGVSKLEKFVHFWVLVGKSFVRNRCPVRASALSYSTLLALIPMLAVAMGVTSSLLKTEGTDQIERFVERFVSSVVPPAEVSADAAETPLAEPAETNAPALLPAAATNLDTATLTTNTVAATNAVAAVATALVATGENIRLVTAQKQAAKYIHDFIQNTQSGTLGTLGMVLLVLVAIRMLANIEETFNDIWGVARGRNWFVRIIQYWATLTLGPLLLIAAVGLASGPHFAATRNVITEMPFIGGFAFKLLPLVVVWLVFALFYQLVPNTKVNFSAALMGGFVGGSLWFLNNYFGFLYVSRVVSNSKIYGSLGLVPVFMAGLYFSWLILLFGAQVAYAFQNRAAYLQDRLAENVNQRGREFIALRLMTCISQRFQRGLAPATAQHIATELGVPSRLVQQVLRPLTISQLVTEIGGNNPAYCPARPLDTINCHQILQAMRAANGQELVTRDEPVRAEVYGEFARIQEAERVAASSVTMLALANRAYARLELVPPTAPVAELKSADAAAHELPAEPEVSERRGTASTITSAGDDKLDFPL